MPDREFVIVFRSDTSQAIAGMNAVGAEFQRLENYINQTGGGLGSMGQHITKMTDDLSHATGQMERTGRASKSMGADMIALSAGFMIIQGGVAAIGNLAEATTKARDHIKELAIETMDLRDKMRELANLKGAKDPDNIVVAEAIKTGMKAGMMPDEVRNYLDQYEGSSPAGEEKGHIDPRTKKELEVEGARFGVRYKLHAQTAGDLAGVISQYTDLTKDDQGKELPFDERLPKAMGMMGRVAYGLNKGRGNLDPLVKSLLNTAGSIVEMGGPVEDLGDLAAIQGVSSTHANPKASGTRVNQAVRALRETKGESAQFLRRTAKIVDTDNHIQRLEKLKVQVDKAKANGHQGYDFLKNVGFNDDDEIRAVIEQVNDLENIKIRVAEGKAQNSGRKVMEDTERFHTESKTGMRREQLAAKAGQEFLIGEESEDREMAKENAEQQLKKEQKIGGAWNRFTEFMGDMGGLGPKFLGMESSRERYKGERAEDNLVKEAVKHGMTEKQANEVLGRRPIVYSDSAASSARRLALRIMNPIATNILGFDARSDQQRIKGFNKLAEWVTKDGGNPLSQPPKIDSQLNEMIGEQRRTNRILEGIHRGVPDLGRVTTFEVRPGAKDVGHNAGNNGQMVIHDPDPIPSAQPKRGP